jgi:hypothetical protein
MKSEINDVTKKLSGTEVQTLLKIYLTLINK